MYKCDSVSEKNYIFEKSSFKNNQNYETEITNVFVKENKFFSKLGLKMFLFKNFFTLKTLLL